MMQDIEKSDSEIDKISIEISGMKNMESAYKNMISEVNWVE